MPHYATLLQHQSIGMSRSRDQGQSILDSASSIDAHIDASALIDRISGANAECRLNHWMPTEVVLGCSWYMRRATLLAVIMSM